MRKISYLLFMLILLLTSCSSDGEVKGTLSNSDCDGKQVFLMTMKDFESPFEAIDSTTISDGKFNFKLKNYKEPNIVFLFIKDAPLSVPNGIPFAYEKGNTNITIDSTAKVTGTPINDKSQLFFDKIADVSTKLEALAVKGKQTDNETEQQKYFEEMSTLNKELSATAYEFVKDNIKNKIGEFYLIQFFQNFDDEQLQKLLEQTTPEYRSKVEKIIADFKGVSSVSFIGKDYINISGETPDGNTISLSEYIGENKVVLIDFWASWCGPCRQEMPNVVRAYNEFKPKGFEIVGVSLDETKNDWVKAIGDLKMTWPQMSDLKGWKSDLGAAYQVTSIPFTLLVDENGKVIAENLRGDELHNKLKELLK